MNKLALTALAGATCLALAGCSKQDAETSGGNDMNATGQIEGGAEANGTTTTTTSTTTASTTAFPKGARIVEEKGVTYRIDADGTRVALTDTDSRIVVENGHRFRVDPDGTRVRIDDRGAVIDVDLPDVDVGINNKGNPDIDVKDKKDGNDGPD
jgi:ribosomal protein S6E (S10)